MSAPLRLCAVDVGTNTLNAVVADVAAGQLTVVADTERRVRLGQGVDAGRRLAEDAMARTLDALAEAADLARAHGAARVVIGATSASRDAANIADFQARVRDALGLDYRVIDGPTEAALSFRGALAMLPDAPAPTQPAVVVDVGGGSTEVVRGTAAGGVSWRTSLDVGSVRLTERHGLAARPLAADALDAARADVAGLLARVPPDLAVGLDGERLPVLATGSVARIAARLARVPGREIETAALAAVRERLLGLSVEETLALDPAALAGRADIVAAAVFVLAAAVERLGASAFTATPGGLRHGLALDAADEAREA